MLSSWQLHRYEYKKNLLQTYQNRLHMLPQPFDLARHRDNLQFLPVAVDGQYENELLMLVQNRFHEGKLGFEVLTPIRMENSDKLLLVDRGWVENPPNSILPNFTKVKNTQHITGYIKYFNEYQFILGKNVLDSQKKPLVMQKIDLKEISALTQKEFYPYILRLDPESENGFVRQWVISSVLPERHIMYALQWLGFALVVIIGFVYFSLERVHE
jgi:surfeit locus 1 family protein